MATKYQYHNALAQEMTRHWREAAGGIVSAGVDRRTNEVVYYAHVKQDVDCEFVPARQHRVSESEVRVLLSMHSSPAMWPDELRLDFHARTVASYSLQTLIGRAMQYRMATHGSAV